MRTEEDEAFDELARKQGMWGGGFKAKQAMAADKQHWNEDEWRRNNWRCGHGWLRGEQCEMCNAPKPAQEAIYGMNQDDWKDVVAAITKVRDGRGIYLACRPADVFQDWFLALGTAKVKEKNT
jgi:hypothetical protein